MSKPKKNKVVTNYLITNTINGKRYTGVTENFNQRMSAHKGAPDDNMAIHAAIRKYGWENFKVEVLYETTDDAEARTIMEPFFIKAFDTFGPNGYNQSPGGEGTPGFQFADSTREKLRAASTGKIHSEETKAKMRGPRPNFEPFIKGKVGYWSPNEEQRKKLSESHMGKNLGNKGRTDMPHLDSTKAKMKESAIKNEYTIRCPDGTVVTTKYLNDFSKEHSISPANLLNYGKTKGYVLLEKKSLDISPQTCYNHERK